MPAFWVEAPDVRSGVVLYCSQSQGIGAVRRWVDVNLKKKELKFIYSYSKNWVQKSGGKDFYY